MINTQKLVVALGMALLTPTVSHAFCTDSLAGSRLQVYCMSNLLGWKATNLGSAQSLDYRLKQEGYSRGIGLSGELNRVEFSPYISPLLEYSSDINGGNPSRPLELGSLTFFGDENFFRKKGVVAGFGVGGTGRAFYGEGKYLEYSIGGSYAHSIEHGIDIIRGFANACSKNDIGKNFYVDGCLTTNQLKRELSEKTTSSASLSLAKLLSDSGENFHQASFGIRRLFDDEYEQNQLVFELDTLHSSGIYTALNASFGGSTENTLTMRNSLNAVLSTDILSKPVSLSASYSYSDGGRILGSSRNETSKSISLTYAVHPRVKVLLGYLHTSSNIDYFNISEIIVGVQFAPIQF